MAAIAAAERARQAADDARQLAATERTGTLHDTDVTSSDAHAAEDSARDAYHAAADKARTKQSGGR